MELPLKTQIDRSERLTPAWIRPVFGRSDPDSDPKLAGRAADSGLDPTCFWAVGS